MENMTGANNRDGICGKRTVDDISSLQPFDRFLIFPPRIPKETSPRKRRRVLEDEVTVSHNDDHQVPPPVAPASLEPARSEPSVAVKPPTNSVRTQMFSFPSGDHNVLSDSSVNQGSAMNTAVPTTTPEDEKMPAIAPHHAFTADDTTYNQVENENHRFIPHSVSQSDYAKPRAVSGSASTTTGLRPTDLGFGRKAGLTPIAEESEAMKDQTPHTSHETTTIQPTGLSRKETNAPRVGSSSVTFLRKAGLSPIAEGSEAMMDNIPETSHQLRSGSPFGGSSPSGFLSSVSSMGSAHGIPSSVSSTKQGPSSLALQKLKTVRPDSELYKLLDSMRKLPKGVYDPRDLKDEQCKQALSNGKTWESTRSHRKQHRPTHIKFVEKDDLNNPSCVKYMRSVDGGTVWVPLDPLGEEGMKSAAKPLAVSLFRKGKTPTGNGWTAHSLKDVSNEGLERCWPKKYFIQNNTFLKFVNEFYMEEVAKAERAREKEQRRDRVDSENTQGLAIAQDQTESSQDPLNVVVANILKSSMEADERNRKERKEIEERHEQERERDREERMHLVSVTSETANQASKERMQASNERIQGSKERMHMLSKTAEIVKKVTTMQRNVPNASETFSSLGEDAATGMDMEVQDSGELRAEVAGADHSLSGEDGDEMGTDD